MMVIPCKKSAEMALGPMGACRVCFGRSKGSACGCLALLRANGQTSKQDTACSERHRQRTGSASSFRLILCLTRASQNGVRTTYLSQELQGSRRKTVAH
jgi:hypothetical protein